MIRLLNAVAITERTRGDGDSENGLEKIAAKNYRVFVITDFTYALCCTQSRCEKTLDAARIALGESACVGVMRSQFNH